MTASLGTADSQMTNQSTTASSAPTHAADPAPTPTPKQHTKTRSKSRRARPRRRAVQSDHESEDEAGGLTDSGSLTDASTAPDDEDDTDDELPEVPDVQKTSGPAPDQPPKSADDIPISSLSLSDSATASLFADTTPLVWADQPLDQEIEEVTFEEFSGRGRGRGRGRGGARGGAPAERKELTEEQLKKVLEKKERKKEKMREKRKAEQEAKAIAKKEAAASAAVPSATSAEASAAVPVPEAATKPTAKDAKTPRPKREPKPSKKKGGREAKSAATAAPAATAIVPATEEDDGGWGGDAPSRPVGVAPAAVVAASDMQDDGGWGEGAPSRPVVVAAPAAPVEPQSEAVDDGGWGEGAPSNVVAQQPSTVSSNAGRGATGSTSTPPTYIPSRPNHHQQPNNLPYPPRLPGDPRFLPRAGNFWPHEQRQYGPGEGRGGYSGSGMRGMGGYGRGQTNIRGEGRGFARGFRGRGRGFGGFQGAFYGPPQGQEGEEATEAQEKDGRLEMDKLEDEERARSERAGKAREAAAEAEAAMEAERKQREVDGEQPEEELPLPYPKRSGKWGHEGFEQMESNPMMAFRGAFRGGRARGRDFMGRGGFSPQGSRQFPPHVQTPISPTPIDQETAPTAVSHESAQLSASHPSSAAAQASAEQQLTQPTVDELLPSESSVTVHLPGSRESHEVPYKASGSSTPTASTPLPYVNVPLRQHHYQPRALHSGRRYQNGPYRPPVQQFQAPAPVPAPSPLPPHLTGGSHRSHHTASPFTPGSENGSIGSPSFIPPPQFLPPGIGVAPNGEYFNLANGAPVDFHPAPSPAVHGSNGNIASQPFFQAGPPPQRPMSGFNGIPQYSPAGDMSSPNMYYPSIMSTPPPLANHDHTGTFRPESPYGTGTGNFHPPPPAQLGYFAPPAPAKPISIRDPSADPSDPSPEKSAKPLPTKSRLSTAGTPFIPSFAQNQAQDEQAYYGHGQAYNPYAPPHGIPVMDGHGQEGQYWYGYEWQGEQGQGQEHGYAGYAYQAGYGF